MPRRKSSSSRALCVIAAACLLSASTGCYKMSGTHGLGTVGPDPSMIQVGNSEFMFTTGSHIRKRSRVVGSSTWSSTSAIDSASLPAGTWTDFWAPEIYKHTNGVYYLFFSAKWTGTGPHNQIFVASSDTISYGKFEYIGIVVTHPDGVIDPDIVVDGDDRYLLYSIDHGGTVCGGNRRLMSRKIWLPRTTGSAHTLLTARNSGTYAFEHCTVENPSMKTYGQYGNYLLYSAGDYAGTGSYYTHLAKCASPTGPCDRMIPGTKDGMTWPIGTSAFLNNPGGADFYQDGMILSHGPGWKQTGCTKHPPAAPRRPETFGSSSNGSPRTRYGR